MAHLIGMELYICFDDVQLLAGKEGFEEGRILMPLFQRWTKTSAAVKAIFHSGQVIRIVSSLDQKASRPLWWPLAIVRAALVLWAYGTVVSVDCVNCKSREPAHAQYTHQTPASQAQGLEAVNGAIGDRALFGGAEMSFFNHSTTPCISNLEGRLIPLSETSEVLQVSIKLLEEGLSMSIPVCEYVRKFLQDIQNVGVVYWDIEGGGT
jgi:hypothetical protein